MKRSRKNSFFCFLFVSRDKLREKKGLILLHQKDLLSEAQNCYAAYRNRRRNTAYPSVIDQQNLPNL